MSKNNLITNDAFYNDYRKDYEDSSEFFDNKTITVSRNTNEERTQEEEDEITGLEQLISTFSTPFHNSVFERHTGQEGLRTFAKSTAESIIEIIRSIGRYLHELFSNRIYRIENKISYLKQKRRANGIRSTPVRYNQLSKRLYVPSMVSANPVWVANCARLGVDFYKRIVESHNTIMQYLKYTPTDKKSLYDLKVTLLAVLGKSFSDRGSMNGVYRTAILPGNRVFNIKDNPGESDAVLTYFTDSGTITKLIQVDWTPDSAIIDDGIGVLDEFIKAIKKEQSNTYTLTGNFERAVNRAKSAGSVISTETRQFYVWLTNLNKRLVNIGLQYVTFIIDGLYGFINSGLKQ